MLPSFTPKWSGPHRRYQRLGVSVAAGMITIIAVLALLILMYFFLPPLR